MEYFTEQMGFGVTFNNNFMEGCYGSGMCQALGIQDEKDIIPNLKELRGTIFILSPKYSTLIGTY